MAFLDYVNEICSEICDVIVTNVNKFYQGAASPRHQASLRAQQQWQSYQRRVLQCKLFGQPHSRDPKPLKYSGQRH